MPDLKGLVPALLALGLMAGVLVTAIVMVIV